MEVSDEITYDSFGNALSETNPAAGNRFKFTARELDAALSLYYYRARWYDPQLGRFLAEDPLSFSAGDANLYRYVFNNPLRYVDPTGLSWWDKVKGFGRGVVNGVWNFVHEAVLIPVDIGGTFLDLGLGLVDSGFGTNLSFGYEAKSYYGRALEERLRHGDLDGFWDLAGTTAVDAFLLGLPSTYVAIEEAFTEGNLEPLGEVLGTYTGAATLGGAGRGIGARGRTVACRLVPPSPTETTFTVRVGRPVITAKDGTKIRGFTVHGIDRVIIGDARKRPGVRPQALLDAVKRPILIQRGVDPQGRPFVEYIGQDAKVIVNPDTGLVVTAWPLSEAGGNFRP
uniref:Hypothetical conserved protein n=1 Tax=uncultured Planctomycetota bacterium TaxID=120965 RepID=H5SE84_9BACT|nr:hypothetical conserved protein [uncultured Planctomycetota bacterium]